MATQIATTQNPYDESQGVAGRVGSLTSQGSPLMTAARTRAKQSMSRSGLQNSSLAGQAGEQAVIETATPIATADAQLYQQQQIENQRNATQVSLANASLAEQGRQFDASQAWNKEQFGTSLMEQRRQFDVGTGLEGRKLDLNDKQFTANLGQQDRQFVQNLQLQRDNLAAQREQFAQRLGLDVAQLDLAKNQMSQQDRQFLADLGLKAQQLEQQDTQFAQRLGIDVQQLELSRNQLSQQDRQFLAELDQKQQQLTQQESQFTREQANRVTLANLDASNRERLMQIEAGYKQDIAGNENISRAWGSMMDSITQIQNNPELDQAAKATMIQNTQNSFAAFANFWKKSTGGNVDVGDLLNFGQAGGGGSGGGSGGSSSDDQYMPVGWTPRGRDDGSRGYTYDETAGRWRKPG